GDGSRLSGTVAGSYSAATSTSVVNAEAAYFTVLPYTTLFRSIPEGSADFDATAASLTLASLTLYHGTLRGTADVHVAGLTEIMEGASMLGTGTTYAEGGLSIFSPFSPNRTTFISRPLVNAASG